MATLSTIHLPSGWRKARRSAFFSRRGITLTWSPGPVPCTLAIAPNHSGQVRSLWMFIHGFRSVLICNEDQGLERNEIEQVVSTISGTPSERAEVQGMIDELSALELIPV